MLQCTCCNKSVLKSGKAVLLKIAVTFPPFSSSCVINSFPTKPAPPVTKIRPSPNGVLLSLLYSIIKRHLLYSQLVSGIRGIVLIKPFPCFSSQLPFCHFIFLYRGGCKSFFFFKSIIQAL